LITDELLPACGEGSAAFLWRRALGKHHHFLFTQALDASVMVPVIACLWRHSFASSSFALYSQGIVQEELTRRIASSRRGDEHFIFDYNESENQ